jgi:hypothetical protein
MSVDGTIRSLFVNSETSLAGRMRYRRWELVRTYFPALAGMKVLDLGGTMSFWMRAPLVPAHVTIVNLEIDEGSEAPWLTTITGDACEADSLLVGQSFDLVFSNSLIEHVGGHSARSALAGVIRSLAPRYFVQTPYRYFPIEPHWLFPAMQFLPVPARRYIAPRWPLGHTRGWEPGHAFDEVLSTELIGAAQMRAYFPDSQLLWERFLGLPKSMVAVRQASDR